MTAARRPLPQTAREFFDLVRQAALRVLYLEDLVAEQARRVNDVRLAQGQLGALEQAAPHVLRHMEGRLEAYNAEFAESTLLCNLAEKIVSRVPEALGERILRARYLQGWEVERVTREFNVSRGTVYNAERRAIEWVDESGILTGTARKPVPARA